MTREHEVDLELAQDGHEVAGVAEVVDVAPGAGHGEDVVVDDDDPRPLGPAAQLGVDPAVVLAPDLALVEVGLGRVDGDDLGEALGDGDGRDRVAGAEEVLEVPVAPRCGRRGCPS